MKKTIFFITILTLVCGCSHKAKDNDKSIKYDKPTDDDYNKALEKIDLSVFSPQEIEAIKIDKPNQIWEHYHGQY